MVVYSGKYAVVVLIFGSCCSLDVYSFLYVDNEQVCPYFNRQRLIQWHHYSGWSWHDLKYGRFYNKCLLTANAPASLTSLKKKCYPWSWFPTQANLSTNESFFPFQIWHFTKGSEFMSWLSCYFCFFFLLQVYKQTVSNEPSHNECYFNLSQWSMEYFTTQRS